MKPIENPKDAQYTMHQMLKLTPDGFSYDSGIPTNQKKAERK